MKKNYLILGGTGAVGYSFTRYLIENGRDATILVRDYKKARSLFKLNANLTIVEGSVLDTALISELVKKVDTVLLAVSSNYSTWQQFLPDSVQSVLTACEGTSKTIIFPGNNYGFGGSESPISELTPDNPCSELGRVRVYLEQMLYNATIDSKIKVLNVRFPEIWGPNVTNETFAPVFKNAISGKSLPWLINADTPQQMIYSLDVGRIIFKLCEACQVSRYEVVHVAGNEVPSMRFWLNRVSELARSKKGISIFPLKRLRVLSWFKSDLRMVVSLAYKYNKSIRFDDTKFRNRVPKFKYTKLDVAILETLDWFSAEKEVAKSLTKTKLIEGAKNFLVENIAIGLFPFAIFGLSPEVEFIQENAVMFGVVAGIYWIKPLKAMLLPVLKFRLPFRN
jgi:nucleoside-diphosphate-sugar epimerase